MTIPACVLAFKPNNLADIPLSRTEQDDLLQWVALEGLSSICHLHAMRLQHGAEIRLTVKLPSEPAKGEES